MLINKIYVNITISCLCFYCNAVNAQRLNPIPRNPPNPNTPLPSAPLTPPIELPSSPEPYSPVEISDKIFITQLKFVGNTIFSAENLGQIQVILDDQLVAINAIQNQNLSLTQLFQITTQIAEFYAQAGYRTSGAIILIPETTRITGKGDVTIQVIEGVLEEIIVEPSQASKPHRLTNYLRSRLGVVVNKPLNVDRLLEALQLLQLDPLVETISAQLSEGSTKGKSRLEVRYNAANTTRVSLQVDNSRVPSIGSVERGISVQQGNLSGLGDQIGLEYFNTNGSNQWNFTYDIPLNAKNGSLHLEYVNNDSWVVEYPFEDINNDGYQPDIRSNYQYYELTLRQPIIQSVKNQTYQEFSLSLGATLLNSQSLLFSDIPLSLSADKEGNTKTFALRFSQEFIQQNAREVWALSSEFSLGMDAFDATIKSELIGVEEIPDSRFFNWRFQGQYVRSLAQDTLWVIQTNLQLSADPLLPSEQFYLGGFGSVRGYRQDLILADNGFFISSEVQVPILRIAPLSTVVQIIPFVDYGIGWNVNAINPDPNQLASVGIGLQWKSRDFTARLDWGIPLVDVTGKVQTWQENGLYFTIRYSPF